MATTKLKKLINDDKEFLFQNYGERLPISFIKGTDSYLYDQDNKEYIDLFSGIAVSNLGYSNKSFKKALQNQIENLIHSSNWYLNKEQIEAAKLLSELAFKGKTLFVNSGTEANEAAIKLARKYGLSKDKKRYEIISFTNSFHGRTIGSMTATGQKKIHDGFGPLPKGFKYLPFNDIEAFEKEIEQNKNITAVITELIQGESGINIADKKFIKMIATICKKNDILLIVDEVQTGVGRTGKPFAFEHYGIKPDVITLAKGLAGGLPVGAIHAKSNISEFFTPGTHGTTFGGNHLAMAGAVAVLKEMKKPSFFKNIEKVNTQIIEQLKKIKTKTNIIKEIRGLGLHIGIELTIPCSDIVQKAMDKGLIVNCAAGNVVRIMPPLTISPNVVKQGIKILEEILLSEEN